VVVHAVPVRGERRCECINHHMVRKHVRTGEDIESDTYSSDQLSGYGEAGRL
jgi:hypothetical protein